MIESCQLGADRTDTVRTKQGLNCVVVPSPPLFFLASTRSIHCRAIMLFSHARQGPGVCLAMSQLGVNACLVMSPQSAEEGCRQGTWTPPHPNRHPTPLASPGKGSDGWVWGIWDGVTRRSERSSAGMPDFWRAVEKNHALTLEGEREEFFFLLFLSFRFLFFLLSLSLSLSGTDIRPLGNDSGGGLILKSQLQHRNAFLKIVIAHSILIHLCCQRG